MTDDEKEMLRSFQAEKLAAEAEARRAQAEKLRAEAEVARLNAQKERLYTEMAANELRLSNIKREKEDRDYTEEQAKNKYHHVYTFSQEVSDHSVTTCINELQTWSRVQPKCDITVIFDSPGGGVISGMALFDFLQQLRRDGHHITTMALGMAASMAGILLQAGNRRIMARESYVLIHEISTFAIGKIGEIEDTVEFVKKIQKRVVGIFMDRCDGKISRRTFEKRWRRKDWWLSSDECLKLGFVDEVR